MSIPVKSRILKERLNSLDPKLRLAFAVDCAAQYLFRYRDWSENEGKGWGRPEILEKAIKLVWHVVETRNVLPIVIEKELEAVNELTPHTEEFPEASSVGALDAACAVAHALKCAVSGDAESAAAAGTSALFASEVILGKGKELRDMSQEALRRQATKESEAEASEWARQLKVLDILSNWGNRSFSRSDFYKAVQGVSRI